MFDPKLLSRLLSKAAVLRNYRLERALKLPFWIRLAFNRNTIRKDIRAAWPGAYVFVDYGDFASFVYIPAPVDVMGGHRLLHPFRPSHFIKALVKRGDTVIDVGANIGDWALPAAHAVGAEGLVLAFEPTPRVAAALGKSALANRLKQLKIFPVALSSAAGEVDFSVEQENTGGSRLGKIPDDREKLYSHLRHFNHIKVQARTLDDVIGEHDIHRVDVIKIDVEGNELSVLEGAQETLRRFKPALFLETGLEDGDSRERMAAKLSSLGYGIVGVSLDGIGMVDATWDDYRRRCGAFEIGQSDMLLMVAD